jgi:hypothetical protein
MNQERLNQLLKAERKLSALEASGVDNWEGYGYALEPLRKEDEKQDVVDMCVRSLLELAGEAEVSCEDSLHGLYIVNIDEETVRHLVDKLLEDIGRIV